MTAKPTVSLTTSGTDPKTTTKQILEAELQRVVDAQWEHAIDVGTLNAADTYDTTAAGLAAVIDGAYFRTRSVNNLALFDYWQRDGASAVFIGTAPSLAGTESVLGQAEAARDAAFVNADVYASTAAGLAAVANGVQFQVAIGDEVARYVDNAGVANELVRFPSAAAVRALKRKVTGVIAETANIFDKDDPEYTDNFFVNHTNGNLLANGDYAATGFIPVVAGQTYFLSSKSFIAWYNAGRVFISGSSNTDTNRVQTAPAGAAFLRASLHIAAGASPETFYVAPGSIALAAYEPYGGRLVVPSAQLPANWIAPLNTTFLERGKNLFDKSTRTLNSIQSTGAVVTNADHDLSDFIAVEEGETYQYRSAAGGARFRACFDSAFANITAQASSVETSSYTVPNGSGVRWMRLSIAKARIDGFMVENAAAPTAFEAFGYRFNDDILPQEVLGLVSKWNGKKASSFGDSLTSQQQWQPAIATALGLLHTAYGVGGRQIAGTSGMCQDAAVNTIPADSELVMVLGGTNDWAQSRALGLPTSTNTEEFYGALNQMCDKLTTRLPSAVICLLTTPYGELPQRVIDLIWTTSHTNNAGLTTRDYAEAIRVAGRRWGMPVIDLSDAGWNTINLSTFMQADGGLIHPNATGGERIARVAIGRLKALEPTS
jgi:lysophospholipase L1-like esterase